LSHVNEAVEKQAGNIMMKGLFTFEHSGTLQSYCSLALIPYKRFRCLPTHLFVKVPRPGDSEVTISVFESSCHLLLPD